MNCRGLFTCFAAVFGVCLSAGALTGSGDSAVGALETVAPVFSSLAVDPAQAAAGDTVTITFCRLGVAGGGSGRDGGRQ